MNLSAAGAQASADAQMASISAGGRYVTFTSGASNLVSGDTNGKWDVFVRDRDADTDGVFDEPGAVGIERVREQARTGADKQEVGLRDHQRARVEAVARRAVSLRDDQVRPRLVLLHAEEAVVAARPVDVELIGERGARPVLRVEVGYGAHGAGQDVLA